MKRSTLKTQELIAALRALRSQRDLLAALAAAQSQEERLSLTRRLLESTALCASQDFAHAHWAHRHDAVLRARMSEQLSDLADAQRRVDKGREALFDAVRDETLWAQLGEEERRKRRLEEMRRESAALDRLTLFRAFRERVDQEQ